MIQLFSLLMSLLTSLLTSLLLSEFLREPYFLLFIVVVLLSVFSRGAQRWIWFSLPLSCAVVDILKKAIFPYAVDRLMDILADRRFVIDTLISERAVRVSVVHCVMPEPEVIRPSIWTWLASYVLPTPLSPPVPMQEICMPTWSHSVHAGSLLACVLLLGVLVVCGAHHLCRQGAKVASTVVEDTDWSVDELRTVCSLCI